MSPCPPPAGRSALRPGSGLPHLPLRPGEQGTDFGPQFTRRSAYGIHNKMIFKTVFLVTLNAS